MLTTFAGNLFCGLETGHILVIGGRSVDCASVVNVNLTSGKKFDSDVALTLSVRFHEDVIVRNSKIAGDWGEEEREDNLHEFSQPNPLVSGDTFQIYIFVSDDRFHIAVNGVSHSTYKFRLPIEDIRCVSVDHDVQSVDQIDHRQAFPFPYPLVQFTDPRMAFSNDTPKPFIPGHVIVITGIPAGNPNGSFILRMTHGDTRREALHFNPRFDAAVVVRNSHNESGNWNVEERSGGFPFAIDQQFKLAIAMTRTEFKFAVNGTFFCSYGYKQGEQILQRLNGFKIACNKGLIVEVTSVDHLHMGVPDCDEFEAYSHLDVSIF